MKYNEFIKDLEYSEEPITNKIINDFYKRKFPNLIEIKEIKNDMELQRAGVDKIIILKNGKKINIDEKKRRSNYGDILLEEWSVLEERKKGWTGDPKKKTDYIVYIIIPANKIYLFPYDLLQSAWRTNYYKWKKNYGIRKAFNHGYATTNIAIPVDILLESIIIEMCNSVFLEKAVK